MSTPNHSERPRKATRAQQRARAGESEGVLSQLPRTRPQRSSPRRAAARRASAAAQEATAASARSNGRATAAAAKAAPKTATAAKAAPKGAKATAKAAPKRAVKRPIKSTTKPFVVAEPAPRQGFECEGERTNGSVHPPGGAELVASAVEIVGELAKVGISTGERLLKDVLSRLPLS